MEHIYREITSVYRAGQSGMVWLRSRIPIVSFLGSEMTHPVTCRTTSLHGGGEVLQLRFDFILGVLNNQVRRGGEAVVL